MTCRPAAITSATGRPPLSTFLRHGVGSKRASERADRSRVEEEKNEEEENEENEEKEGDGQGEPLIDF